MFTTALALLFLMKLFLKTNFYAPMIEMYCISTLTLSDKQKVFDTKFKWEA